MNDHPVESAPAGEYSPDETHVEALFARPAPSKPETVTWEAGHVFKGIDPEEADRVRYENLHRRPVRVKKEDER
jgi:hypothetical protein